MSKEKNYWAIIPAAGTGYRMGTIQPKQYLHLHGKPIIEHTINRLSSHETIKKIVVVLAPNDTHWPNVTLDHPNKIITTNGGNERCHSVLNGLHALKEYANPDDWVLVHDAVRPCIQHQDIDKLIQQLSNHPVGGLLGIPVKDTLKRIDENGRIIETVDRKNTWHALTPQMFRFNKLQQALENAINNNHAITDEASAIQLSGSTPLMIEGDSTNIKITHPQDLLLAEKYINK